MGEDCDCKVNEILEAQYDQQVLLNTELVGEIDALEIDRDRWRELAITMIDANGKSLDIIDDLLRKIG
jgi:hypothetical protein